MYLGNSILFPNEAIAALERVRGPEWTVLVRHVEALAEEHPAKVAFVLMMVRLNGCLVCETDSFRAMQGCQNCALQTITRFKGDDKKLLNRYHEARDEVDAYLEPDDPIYVMSRRVAA